MIAKRALLPADRASPCTRVRNRYRSFAFRCLRILGDVLLHARMWLQYGPSPPKLLIVRSERVPCRNSGVPFYWNLMMVPAFSCGW